MMATIFWDRKKVIMVELIQQVTTTASGVYCETLKELRKAIQKERRGMLTFGLVLIHYNAHPHTAARTLSLLEHFNWPLFDHPPYSPVLAPNDYHLFTHLKNWLDLRHFNKNEE
jgi:histone-lysine N-methyltransferase SETMAR